MAKNEYPCTDVQPVLIYGHDGTVIRRIKVDAAGTVEVQEKAFATVISGHKTIAAAGAQAALAATTTVKTVSIKALNTNTGLVYVGGSAVSSANGYELNAGEAIDLDINKLASVYIDVQVNGEGVGFIAGV